MKLLLNRTIVSILIFTFSFSAPGLTLKIKQGRNLRNSTNIFTVTKRLKAGTVITIPDEFVNKNFKGNKRDQVAVLNWLGSSRFIAKTYRVDKNGKDKKDFFVPVIVNKTKEDGWVSLRSLAKKGGLELVTTEDTDLVEEVPLGFNPNTHLHPPTKNSKYGESEYVCINPTTKSEDELFETLPINTNKVLHELLKDVTKEANTDVKNRLATKDIIKNFNKTCRPYKFKSFYKMLKKKAKKNHIPVDFLLGVMTQESSGKCNRINPEDDTTASVGLFQINTESAKLKLCSKSTRKIASAGATKATCLENPVSNLNEAIRIFRNKFNIINDHYPKYYGPILNKYPEKQRNYWRKATSSYNGGSGYVSQAYKDIKEFNKQYETDLDQENWEIRKIFMLRRIVEKKGAKVFKKGFKAKNRRKNRHTLSNLTYVEAIMSNEREYSKKTQTSKWTNYVMIH